MIKLAVNIAFVFVFAVAELAVADVPSVPTVLPTDMIELGKKLFIDPRLSASGLISCYSCHKIIILGVDLHETLGRYRHGEGEIGISNSSLDCDKGNISNYRLSIDLTGAVKAGLEMELGNNEEAVLKTLKNIPGYGIEFRKVFPNEMDTITFINLDKSITSFLATLSTYRSYYDIYLPAEPLVLTTDLKDNMWGVASISKVGDSIFDKNSGPALGKVVYAPFLEFKVRDAGIRDTGTTSAIVGTGSK